MDSWSRYSQVGACDECERPSLVSRRKISPSDARLLLWLATKLSLCQLSTFRCCSSAFSVAFLLCWYYSSNQTSRTRLFLLLRSAINLVEIQEIFPGYLKNLQMDLFRILLDEKISRIIFLAGILSVLFLDIRLARELRNKGNHNSVRNWIRPVVVVAATEFSRIKSSNSATETSTAWFWSKATRHPAEQSKVGQETEKATR